MSADHTVWKDPDLARAYLEGVRGAVPCSDEQIDIMTRLIAAAGRPVRRFLDLGCGDGILGARILERYPDAAGVFLDQSETMLAAAREKLSARHPSAQFVEYDYGDRNWITCVEGPFDAIVSGFSIHHQPDDRKREIYREIFEILSAGGFFVNIEHVASATPWLSKQFDERFIDALHDYEAARSGNGNSARSRQDVAQVYYHRDDKSANILAPVETQCAWLREIGFDQVDCYFKLFELAVFGGCKPETPLKG